MVEKVIVVGGGPGGVSCAMKLLRMAREMGREIHVSLYEGKRFVGEIHHNQCVGILSPPIREIMEGLGIPFPADLVQREITGYVLHSRSETITLDEEGEVSYAIRRVAFDEYMLSVARKEGVEVIEARVTDVEIHPDRVEVFSESESREASVLVGAFGMDDGSAAFMMRASRYRRPGFLTSIVTKVHPPERFMEDFGNRIHVFLIPIRGVEFGAITPKGNHLTINIAGRDVTSSHMWAFLRDPRVREVLGPVDLEHPSNPKDMHFFKSRFPMGTADGFFGNRYVLIGDAAGLVRPFKGKGVNGACISGSWAAEAIMTAGISYEAFKDHYLPRCSYIISDLPFGRFLRWATILSKETGIMDMVVGKARIDRRWREAVYQAISANKMYREILLDTIGLDNMIKFAASIPLQLLLGLIMG
jgi:flavin-dependent dehydrogenase